LVTRGEISTPALTIDLGAVERNLERMAAYCRDHGLGLRPHTKTHKTPEVARMQLERGACGLNVAKVGEAEVMAAATDAGILVAYPIFGGEKLCRLAALANARTLLMALDHEATAREVSRAASAQLSTVGVLVEFDVGLGRCGLDSGARASNSLLRSSKCRGSSSVP
jgi:D-serine deaminase-like pyridoxal phosphate-dependent protein